MIKNKQTKKSCVMLFWFGSPLDSLKKEEKKKNPSQGPKHILLHLFSLGPMPEESPRKANIQVSARLSTPLPNSLFPPTSSLLPSFSDSSRTKETARWDPRTKSRQASLLSSLPYKQAPKSHVYFSECFGNVCVSSKPKVLHCKLGMLFVLCAF